MGDEAEHAFESGEIADQLDYIRDEFDSQKTTDSRPSAGDLAQDLTTKYMKVLEAAGHLPCSLADIASVVPQDQDSPAAVACGCGEFFEAPEFNERGRELAPDELVLESPKAVTVPAADPLARAVALIDPGHVVTPAEVEERIRDCVNRLETGAAMEVYWVRERYRLRHAYDQAYARAYNQANGPVETRRQAAIEACAQEAYDLSVAEAMEKGVKAAMHNVRAALSGYQSTARSVRAAYESGASGGRGDR